MVTLLPSKNLNGFGSFEFAVVGNVFGTLQVAWRSSIVGAASTVADRSGMMTENFISMELLFDFWMCGGG